jgi:hypothetical protein
LSSDRLRRRAAAPAAAAGAEALATRRLARRAGAMRRVGIRGRLRMRRSDTWETLMKRSVALLAAMRVAGIAGAQMPQLDDLMKGAQKLPKAPATGADAGATDEKTGAAGIKLGMNRAAEAAAPLAQRHFGDAMRDMSLEDVRAILGGGDTAATDFFRRQTHDPLDAAFKPIVSQKVGEVGATRAYKDMMGLTNPTCRARPSVGVVDSISPSGHTAQLESHSRCTQPHHSRRRAICGDRHLGCPGATRRVKPQLQVPPCLRRTRGMRSSIRQRNREG